MDAQIQKLRLIVNGAVCLYEGQGLEIPALLEAQNRDDLLTVLDAIVAALYCGCRTSWKSRKQPERWLRSGCCS